MKNALTSIALETTAREHNAITLVATILLKYGIAPIACIYLGYILMLKDATIEKNNDRLVNLVEKQTAATVQNTQVLTSLQEVIKANTSKLNEIEWKTPR